MVRAGSRVLQAHAGRLSYPLKVNLCVTYWCQYRCQTCNIWKRKPTDELSTDELLQFVRQNPKSEWLDITGGEIFLRPDIEEVLDAVLTDWRRLVVLHFPTNGFLSDKIVQTTTRLRKRHQTPIVVTVSLDGDEALNDAIRGIKGGYRRQIETFNRLRASGVSAVLGMTVSKFNADRVEDVFRAVERDCPGITARDFHVNVAQTSAHYYGTAEADGYRASPDEATAALAAYERLRGGGVRPADVVETRYLRLMRRFMATGVSPQPCHALRSTCFIDPWGTVYPCITYDHPIGRLRDHGMRLDPIWSGDAALKLQTEIWNGRCPQCWTACEAFPTIVGNALAPWRKGRAGRPGPSTDAAAVHGPARS